MRMQLLGLSAAALLLAGVAQASPDPAIQAFLAQAQSKAESQVNAAGVDLNAHSVRVKAYIADEGRLASVHVADSSGSRDLDDHIERAVKQVRLTDVPPGLVGATLTLQLGHGPLAQAKAR